MNLFDYVRNDKQEKLDQALDSIRQKYGSKAVMRGSFLEEKRPPKATLTIDFILLTLSSGTVQHI